ncbi:MAG: YfiR family protein [Bacteroidota bacterium]
MKPHVSHSSYLFLLLLTAILICSSFTSVEGPDTNAKVKAIFLYNFSKHVEWPEAMATGRFKIGIYGTYPTLWEELERMSKIKRRGDRSFEIIQFDRMDKIVPTHILFVVKNNANDLTRISKQLKNSSTLLVTEEEGYIKKGAHINLYYENNKQKMELNPSTFGDNGLKASSQLVSISKVVNG